MIWEGGVRVTEKNKIIKVTFVDKTGKIFAETTLPSNPREAVVKTLDSSRGYAIRLQNPKGGFLWVGVGFRDRTDAFDFGATLQDYSDRTKMYKDADLGTRILIL